MNTRLGNILYGAGLFGAALSLLYAIDAIWVHESGQSLLPISGRYVSRDDMLVALGIGVLLALLFWGAGVTARLFVNRSVENRPSEDDPSAAAAAQPVPATRRRNAQP